MPLMQEDEEGSSADNRGPPVGLLPPQGSESFWEEGAGISEDTADDPEATEMFERIMNPVVRLYCRHTEPNFSLPWQREREISSSSTGFAVQGPTADDRWLLTNAHAVEYCSQVRRASMSHRF
jgi:hypothetical protein